MGIEISAIRPGAASAGGTRAAAGTATFAECLRAASGRADEDKKTDLGGIFREAAARYGVPENLLKAVAKAESGFRADAVSRCGAQGIMQLMPSTAASLGVTDSFDPGQNILGGAKYLGGLLRSYGGDEKLALAAYNAGSGNVKKYGGIPPFKETQSYVRKVLAWAGGPLPAEAPQTASAPGTGISGAPGAGAVTAGAPVPLPEFSEEDFRRFVGLYIQQMEQDAADAAEKDKKPDRV